MDTSSGLTEKLDGFSFFHWWHGVLVSLLAQVVVWYDRIVKGRIAIGCFRSSPPVI